MRVSFFPCKINTGQCIYEIASRLSYFYLTRNFPIDPACSFANYFTLQNGLIRAKHLGLGVLILFLFRSNSRATPVPIDLPITIIFDS